MAALDGVVAHACGIDNGSGLRLRLTQCAQVEVVLEELAKQLASVVGDAYLELIVGEARRRGTGEELDQALVKRSGGRERVSQLRGRRLPTSLARPALPFSSSRRRSSR
jgi:hypothetical protein